MQFLNGNEAAEIIREQAGSSSRCKMAVAFWGRGAAQDLGLFEREQPFQIVMNLEMGGTNPSEAKLIMERCRDRVGSSLQHRSDLHSKVYLFDDCVIIGSSNASANGLSYQNSDGSKWLESNVLINDLIFLDSVNLWFDDLVAHDVDNNAMERAEKNWNARRMIVSSMPNNISIEDYIRNKISSSKEIPAYLVITTEIRSSEADEMVNKLKKDNGNLYDAYEDYDDLPSDGWILDIFCGPRGGLTFEYFKRTSSIKDLKIKDGTSINIILREASINGMKKREDNDFWKNVVSNIKLSDYWNNKYGNAIVPFSDLVRFFHSGRN